MSGLAFVIGCARSGTTVLADLISAHPDVAGVFEAHAVWERAGAGPDGSHRLVARDATPEVRTELGAWARREGRGHALLVEKNPRNTLRVPFLRTVFPQARFVHVVRDGRDTAWSLLPGIGGDHWSHLKPPEWRALMHQEQGLVRCALVWRAVVEIALADLDRADHLTVRYKDLVAQPRREAERVRTYLSLSRSDDYDAFCDRIQNSTAFPAVPGSARWDTADHAVRVGRRHEHAGSRPDEARAVERLLMPLLARLGYTADGVHP